MVKFLLPDFILNKRKLRETVCITCKKYTYTHENLKQKEKSENERQENKRMEPKLM